MTTSTEQAEAQINEGLAQVRSGDFASAAISFQRAVEADPGFSIAHNNLGSALVSLGRHREAMEAFQRAIQLDDGNVQAYVNLGDALRALGQDNEAHQRLVEAIEIDPHFGPAYFSLGQAHQSSGRLNEALACYLQAGDLLPDDADVFTALGSVLMQFQLGDAARQAFERALSIDPSMGSARAHVMHRLARDCDWNGLDTHMDWIEQLGVTGDPVPPFTLLAFEDQPERHRIRSERFAAATYSRIRPMPLPARPAKRPDRLRIAYLSADFYDHATMFLAARMFELHDRGRFEIRAYSYGREDNGTMRGRASQAFDEFRDVRTLSDKAIADMVRDDAIDIAVDLKGYTGKQRLGIFAYRPAPVQITFLGYPGTLGAPFIDYLVADRVVVPPEQRGAYSEHLIQMPHTYQVNDNRREIPRGGQSRTEAGLPQDGFVFCCFNNTYKIKRREFDVWMALLQEVEGSVLWLLKSTAAVEGNLRAEAVRRGVDPKRLVFAPKVDPAAHLARQQHADIFLDTFNCNAHTTASDALWAGLPVVTKAGSGFAARVGASLLQAIGLNELVTADEHEYAELALSLAKDPKQLGEIRAKLEANRATTPLFDSESFTRHMELAYDLAFDRVLKGREPADIIVPA